MEKHNLKTIKLRAKRDWPRIDHFLCEHLSHLSRSKIEKLLHNSQVKLNGKTITKKSAAVSRHDLIEVELSEIKREFSEQRLSAFQFKKLFEDEYLLIIDKPAGISVHPGTGESAETILDYFRFNYPEIAAINDYERPGIVHRLDKDTSGILVLAKDERTMKRMQKKFKKREIKKIYLALVSGHLRFRNGVIDIPIARSAKDRRKFTAVTRSGQENMEIVRPAVTEFSVLYEFSRFSLVRLSPLTGRTHQLRVHLSHYGNAILGDRIYGKGSDYERLALHAAGIEFSHPIHDHLLAVSSPLPRLFRSSMMQAIKEQKKASP